MKKVLVTGAAGTIGLQTIRFLLSEGKYEITALELKNIRVYRRLKKFRKRINRIIFEDRPVNSVQDIHRVFETNLKTQFKTVFKWNL